MFCNNRHSIRRSFSKMSNRIENYDSVQLISEVEKRRILYDKHMVEYHDKFVREDLWREVCAAIIPNWDELTDACKDRTGSDVQRKWKNIRDCFRKDLNVQRKWKAAGGKRKRRKYIFYDQLLFLLPTIQERGRQFESPSSDEDAEKNIDEVSSIAMRSNKAARKTPIFRQKKRKHSVNTNKEESCMPALPDNKLEEVDEDKYYLLSLLPSFRNLSPDQKFTAKIEFLKTLRNLTYPSASNVPASLEAASKEQPHASFELADDGSDIQIAKQEVEDF